MRRILLFSYILLLLPLRADLEKDFFSSKKINESLTLRLRFQEIKGNYLAFYHSEGLLFLLAFRKHRWDYSQEEILKNLQRGNEYEVEFQWLGLFFNLPDKYQTLDEYLSNLAPNDNFAHEIRKKQKFVLGKIIRINFSLLKDLRF